MFAIPKLHSIKHLNLSRLKAGSQHPSEIRLRVDNLAPWQSPIAAPTSGSIASQSHQFTSVSHEAPTHQPNHSKDRVRILLVVALTFTPPSWKTAGLHLLPLEFDHGPCLIALFSNTSETLKVPDLPLDLFMCSIWEPYDNGWMPNMHEQSKSIQDLMSVKFR